ncbi:MAG: hydrogenase formation protein HypD [Coriobacteriia bacterium]|nr:hydrogenase formation protein HypD [Coriobacteriia bacterium]
MTDILKGFRDPEVARRLVDEIHRIATEPCTLMEVCGTHTMAIAKNGLRGLMPDTIKLLSGPGCPVCVTANPDIDHAIEIARQPGVVLTTFGDMMKVPGSYSSLSREKAEGRDVRIVYSPLDSLAIAEREPDKHVVFLGVGFETTAPTVALTIREAARRSIPNWSALSLHKTVPGALEALVNDPEVRVTGFILPGHVSTIIGTAPYEFLATKYGVPGVVTGFEPVDVLLGVWMLVKQLAEGRAEIEIAYGRGVEASGNLAAITAIEQAFEPYDTEWRGIGVIPGTGLALRPEYAGFDARTRVPVTVPESREIKGCQCGDVLRGVVLPFDCKLFGKGCTPEHPIGPCMVSSEGSCAAYYRYTDYGKE